MIKYIATRLGHTLILVVGITLITFILSHVVPSDPAAIYAGPRPEAAQIATARQLLGLDKPLYVQYWIFLTGLVTGNWGTSLRTHQPVLADLGVFFPVTLELVIAATILAMAIGIPVGVYASARPNGTVDALIRAVTAALISIPAFWLALLLQIFLFGQLHLLPLAGEASNKFAQNLPTVTGFPLLDAVLTGNVALFWDELSHLILPALALAAYPIGIVARMTRANMLDTLSSDFILMARANGYPGRRIYTRYALKNAIGATFTVLGLIFAFSLTGDFFIELIFYWQGLGVYAVNSIQYVDTPAILAVVVIVAIAYTLVNLVVDVMRAMIDSRVAL
jgi:ABC-type dipeptide/oligopeptide/nickel transport system permease component